MTGIKTAVSKFVATLLLLSLDRIAATANDSSWLLQTEQRDRSVSRGHVREPCKNGWTHRDVVL